MKLNKFTVILAILLISILAIGAVSAESVDDSSALAIDEDVGEVQESVEPTDVAEDLSTADDTAENIVEDDGGAVGEGTTSYDLDDYTYSTYFNEDGTATEKINESSDYTLNIGTLNNKDIKITYGSHINIVGKEGAGFINNGTIYLDGGAEGLVGSITISGLTFTNTNKNCIDIAEYCTDINIKENTINLIGDASLDPANKWLTVTAIAPHNFIYGLNIIDNKITVTGDAPYSNGIWAMNWGAVDNPSNFNISGNIFDLNVSAESGSAMAIFVECSDSVIENNVVIVKTVGETFAYGIQLPDNGYANYMDYYEGIATSFNNVEIKNNVFDLTTEYMAYGISMYNYGADGYDEDWLEEDIFMPNFSAFPLNITVSDNSITIKSDRAVYGIVAQLYEMNIVNNKLTIIGGSSEGVRSQDLLGVGTVAIEIQYSNRADVDYNVTVENNDIFTNVTAEHTNNQTRVSFNDNIYEIQNDDGEFIVTDNTYNVFFDEKGNLKDIIPAGSTVLLGNLQNKNLKIDIPLNIKAKDSSIELYATSITLNDGADGTIIDGLNFASFGELSTSSVILVNAVDNITIKNNQIRANEYSKTIYGIQIAGGSIGCDNINITGNTISVNTNAKYAYGIDVWGYGGDLNTNITISDNNIIAYDTSKMAEAVYLNFIDTVHFENNIITVTTGVNGYGVGADTIYNADFKGNEIHVESENQMAYGITTTNSENVTFLSNDITVNGEGAVGIGLANDNRVDISQNIIAATGGDYLSVVSGDYLLGAANAAILNKSGNTNLTIGENTITENFPLIINNDNYATYFNEDGTIKEGADMGNYIVLDKLTDKTIVVDRPLSIEGTATNTQIKVVAGADGTQIFSLDMDATTTSGNFAFISVLGAEHIDIRENNLVIACNNDLSTWDTIMAIEINGATTGCNNINVDANNIVITGQVPYAYGVDVYTKYGSGALNNYIAIQHNNITIDINGAMSEAIYLSSVNNSYAYANNISSTSTDAAYGIASNDIHESNIERNDVTVKAGGMAYGVTATTKGKDVTISHNIVDVIGTGAMGIGVSHQDGAIISDNDVAIDGGDYTTTSSWDELGVGNAAIFEGDGNTNTVLSNNKVEEFTSVQLECANLTVTAAPTGKGTFEVTLKTLDGKVLANKEITFSFNSKVVKAMTDENGIAKLSFDLNKAGKYTVDIAFLGDKQYRGAFATAKLTINKIKSALTASAKTFLATATTKQLTATLKDAKGNLLAKKAVTFTVNGKTYKATTNAKGVATVKLALTAAKTYKVSIKFAGDSVYAASTKAVNVKLNKEATKLIAPNKTFKAALKTKSVVVTLRNSKNKPIANKKVTLVVNKKKYTVKTNSKGQATFKVALTKKGTYSYTAQFATDTQYKAVKKVGKIIVN